MVPVHRLWSPCKHMHACMQCLHSSMWNMFCGHVTVTWVHACVCGGERVHKIICTCCEYALFTSSMSKNPIGDRGFEILLDALIAKPKGPIKKLG